MKRTIIIEILLCLTLITLIPACVTYGSALSKNIEALRAVKGWGQENSDLVAKIYSDVLYGSIYFSVFILGMLFDLSAMILIAIRDFPVFKPLLEKLNAKKARKQQIKAEKVKVEKQNHINKLQAEITKLKKDE